MKTMYFGIITNGDMKAIKAIAFDSNRERDAAWEAVREVRHGGCKPEPYMWMVNVTIDEKTLEVVTIKDYGINMSESMYQALYSELDDRGIN